MCISRHFILCNYLLIIEVQISWATCTWSGIPNCPFGPVDHDDDRPGARETVPICDREIVVRRISAKPTTVTGDYLHTRYFVFSLPNGTRRYSRAGGYRFTVAPPSRPEKALLRAATRPTSRCTYSTVRPESSNQSITTCLKPVDRWQ